MKKVRLVLFFIFFYVTEIIKANWKVAYDILTVKQHYRDGVVKISIGEISNIRLAILVNLITMTPGTICLNFDTVSGDLIVHLMFMDEAEKVISKIQKIYLPFVKLVIPC